MAPEPLCRATARSPEPRSAGPGLPDARRRSAVTCYPCRACSTTNPPGRPRPNRSTHDLRSSRALRRPPPLVDRDRVGGPDPRRRPVRAPRARGAVGWRLHPRRPGVGAREAAPPAGARRGAVGLRDRLHLGHADRRHAGLARRRERSHEGHRRGAARHPRPVAPGPAKPSVRGRPHRLRHRVPGPAARQLAGRHPTGPGGAPRGPRSPSESAAAPRSTAMSSP